MKYKIGARASVWITVTDSDMGKVPWDVAAEWQAHLWDVIQLEGLEEFIGSITVTIEQEPEELHVRQPYVIRCDFITIVESEAAWPEVLTRKIGPDPFDATAYSSIQVGVFGYVSRRRKT